MTKRSMHYPLKERAAGALKGCLKEGMQKVAFEPGAQSGRKIPQITVPR